MQTLSRTLHTCVLAGFALASAACGLEDTPIDQEALAVHTTTMPASDGTQPATSTLTASAIENVIVVMMENQNASDIYGKATAPYLNQLMKDYAYATNFGDVLPDFFPSEPHYVWLEAGTNNFSDHAFLFDSDASSSNSTGSTAHLVNQLEKAGISWATYQEGIDSSTGACAISSSRSTQYAAKHNPFVFFRDVSGSPPSKTSARCVAHTRPLSQLSADLRAGRLPRYTLITPNLCHDMHGAPGCPSGSAVTQGDTWLKGVLPDLIAFASANKGVILLTWDEPEGTPTQPFLVIGPHLKRAGYASKVRYDMSSVLKSIQRIFGVTPLLGHAADTSTNDLGDFFAPGYFP